MTLTKKLLTSGVIALGLVTANARAGLYDDFESGKLDSTKWDVRQDPEGQPMFDEYDVRQENNNYVFHTKQNTNTDRRTYLVPTFKFTTGDSIEYDADLISRDGTYTQMILLTGDDYIRMGIFGWNNGVQGYDELGKSHIKLEFKKQEIDLTRQSPNGETLHDALSLKIQDGNYEVYVGSFSGSDGKCHIDYDNFYTTVPEPSTLVALAAGAVGLSTARRRN